ncbi:MAG TPA: PspC domain-containing protein [Flavobacteriaceae bacterium]|nr:PspC domain-containing protein [Flavobacteriaceae bacterium]
MNKTININLGGIFFHIDEFAYQKLRRYLDAIRRSLSDDPQGRDEILNDIEQRIGELLSERVKDERQVINEGDIDEITKIMGKPEDYLVDEELFEDEPKHRSRTSNKKLFRDGEDKFLGGVSSGLAHYFGIEPLWLRIIWLVLTIPTGGATILVYILLWILIPVAETTTEKLQMKGEPVNISNIEKKIREEFNEVSASVKDGVNSVTEKVKSTEFKSNVGSKARNGFQEIIDTLVSILTAIFKVFGKFIGVLLILVAALTLIGLIIGGFSWGSVEILGFGDDFIHYPPFFYTSVLPGWLLVLFSLFAIGIPFFILFMLGLKILSSNVKSLSTTTKLTLLGIWIISLLGLGFAAINFATQTAYNGAENKTETLPIMANDTLTINMVADKNYSYHSDLKRRWSPETVVHDNGEEILYSNRIHVDIKPTNKENAYVKIRQESEGQSKIKANENAEAISYEFKLDDKNLLLNGYFLSDLKSRFKDQSVDITIYLPIDAVIYLEESTKTFLYDVDNVQDIYDRDMPMNYFKMTSKGLDCMDCNPDIFRNDFDDDKKFNLEISEDSVKVQVNNGTEEAEVEINQNGVTID